MIRPILPFCACACVCVCVCVCLQAGDAPTWVGYGGPGGTRVYADAHPPTSFGTGDISWRTKLTWGHGSPIVVGDKVFVQCEYLEGEEHYPSLVAIDTADGQVAWKAPLDHTPVLKNGAAIKAAWETVMTDLGRRRVLLAEYLKSGKSDAVNAKIVAAGYEYNARWNRIIHPDKNFLKAEYALMKPGGFALETWRQGLGSGTTVSCVGQAYSTPVSDGVRVYASTAFGGFFAFDLTGKPLWVAAVLGQAGEYCRNGRSPIIWHDLLISDITNKVRAFDRATGQLMWSDDGPAKLGKEGAHTIVTPAVITVGGRDILYAAGNCAYLLPDGKRLTVEGWQDYGMQTLVKHDEPDVVFFCGSGEHCGWTDKGNNANGPQPPAAVRFHLEGDVLKATVLWHGGTLGGKDAFGGNAPWMLYHAGGFYHTNGAILDPLTGAVKAGTLKRGGGGAVPPSGHLLCVAGDHVYGLVAGKGGKDGRNPSGTMTVSTLDGKQVAANTIPDFTSYGKTFTFGPTAIYVRGTEELVRIGR